MVLVAREIKGLRAMGSLGTHKQSFNGWQIHGSNRCSMMNEAGDMGHRSHRSSFVMEDQEIHLMRDLNSTELGNMS